MQPTRSNILLLQVDQLTASKLKCYGDPVSVSPNISHLANQGSVFEQAYSNFPLCAPSRFSMLSGRLASNIGVYDNGSEFYSSIPTIPHFLAYSGYQTCLVGKMHFVGADQLHGYESRLTTDIYPADFGWAGDWTEIRQRHSNDLRSFTQAGICLRNPQMEYDEEVTHRARRKLYDLARENDDRPFFLTVSFTHPHDPYQCPQEYWDLYPHHEIPMPTTGVLPDQLQDPYSMRLMQQYGLDKEQLEEELVRTARHAYYGSISYIDQQIGSLLKTLVETGFERDTTIILTSDHGDMLGERGLWYKKSFFEDSVRVPLIIHKPGVSPSRIHTPVSLMDLLPTLIEIASTKSEAPDVADTLEGNSLVQLMHGQEDNAQRVVYSENLAEGAMAPILMVRNNRFKYVCSAIDPEQLFDLSSDPMELNNLAGNPEYQTIKQRLKNLVEEKWNLESLRDKVLHSQEQRLFIRSVLDQQRASNWDFNPGDQASGQCLRADTSYNDWAYNDVIGLTHPGSN